MSTWESGREKRRLLLTYAILVAFWTSVIAYVLLGSVLDHPLRASYRERQNLIAISPQGWGFFTRDPREPVELIYRWEKGRWLLYSFSNSSLRNLLGVRRAARASSVELQPMLAQVPSERWVDCKGAVDLCLRQAAPARVKNRSTLKRLCGRIGVERRPPIPWAWSRHSGDLQMPGKVVQLEAVCAEEADRSRRNHT